MKNTDETGRRANPAPAKNSTNTPKPISECLAGRTFAAAPDAEQRAAEFEAREQQRQRDEALADLRETIGLRYRNASLDSFELNPEHAEKQRAVLAKLRSLAERLPAHVAAGENLVVFGPTGTGKDLLARALLIEAARRFAITSTVLDGPRLAQRFRDAMKSGCEESLVRSLVAPQILLLSDPATAAAGVSSHSLQNLFSVVDGRYVERRSVWTTLNVASRDDAKQLLGGAIFDRLSDNAITAFCSWPSYRKTIGDQEAGQ